MTEQQLRDLIREFMSTANTNATGEGAQAGSRTFDARGLDRMSMADMLRFVKEAGVGVNSRMGEVALGDDDPLVAQFLEQFGARDWGNVEAPDSGNRAARGFMRGYGDPSYGQEGADGVSILADGTRVLKLPDGTYVREEANINSDEVAGQHRADETQNRQSYQDLARVVGGAAGVAGLQAAGVLGQGTSMMGAAPGGGFGTAAGTAANLGGAAGAAGGFTGAANIPGDLPYNTGTPGGGASVGLDAMPSIQQGGGGLAGLGQATGGATIPGDIAASAGGGSSIPLAEMPGIQAAGGGASGLSGLVDSMGGYNGIARGVVGLASLGAAAGGGGGGGGGETDPQNIIEQMANANRVNHNTPIGSRAWSRGPDGQWTVNDTMSEPEQRNFNEVQGMNFDVTGEARKRLAALMAAAPRQRYDRPLGS